MDIFVWGIPNRSVVFGYIKKRLKMGLFLARSKSKTILVEDARNDQEFYFSVNM